MMIPKELKYTNEHEWLRDEGGLATIGITHHAQEQLGDVVYVELPAVGAQVKQGETFGTIESVKAASDLYSPITGEVTEVNAGLADKPELVNTDPYGAAWLIKIKPKVKSEVDNLLSAADYAKLVG